MNKIPIIYQDNDIIAVNKPAHVEVQEVVAAFPDTELGHRLDKDTSGVLLLAKSKHAREYLKKLFQAREIKKTYIALVEGRPPVGGKNKEGIIDLPISRSPHHPSRRVAKIDAPGASIRGKKREARTRYIVKKFFPSSNYTLLELFPETGRTHQIRVHLKAIGHPVVCDKLYRAKTCPTGLDRQFLHAAALEFTLPPASSIGGSGGKIRLEADLPEDLQIVLNTLS